MRQGKTDGGRRGIRIFLGLAAGAAAVAVLITAGLHLLGEYQERQKRRAYPYPEEYAALIEKNAQDYGIPPEIICAVIRTESSFRADVVSPAGAVGLMRVAGPGYARVWEMEFDAARGGEGWLIEGIRTGG